MGTFICPQTELNRIPKRQHIRPISVIGYYPHLPSQSSVRGQILAFWSVILGKGREEARNPPAARNSLSRRKASIGKGR